jgi:hypothetical protein
VKDVRREAQTFKEMVADLTLDWSSNRICLLGKRWTSSTFPERLSTAADQKRPATSRERELLSDLAALGVASPGLIPTKVSIGRQFRPQIGVSPLGRTVWPARIDQRTGLSNDRTAKQHAQHRVQAARAVSPARRLLPASRNSSMRRCPRGDRGGQWAPAHPSSLRGPGAGS